jgi:hypothetical protein
MLNIIAINIPKVIFVVAKIHTPPIRLNPAQIEKTRKKT